MALEEILYSPETIIIRGQEPELSEWHKAASRHYAPKRITLAIPADEQELAGLLSQPTTTGETIAYICKEGKCLEGVKELAAFEEALKPGQASSEAGIDLKFEGPVGSFKRHRE